MPWDCCEPGLRDDGACPSCGRERGPIAVAEEREVALRVKRRRRRVRQLQVRLRHGDDDPSSELRDYALDRVPSGQTAEDDEDDSGSSAAAYAGRTLESVWEIQQDEDDSDCGPTAAAFLRYGGATASGAPREAGEPVTGATIQELARRMRAEGERTDVPASHGVGTSVQQMREILEEFAGVHEGRRYTFSTDTEHYDIGTPGAPGQLSASAFRAYVAAFVARLAARLGASPRGVLVGIRSTGETLPSQARTGTLHWVVATSVGGGEVEFHDPGHGYGRRTYPAAEFALAHAEHALSQNPLVGLMSFNSNLTAAEADPAEVADGDVLCEVDAGWTTWGQTLEASAPGRWYPTAEEADARAREVAGEHSAVVIEAPPGNFLVVPTAEDEVSVANGEAGTLEYPDESAISRMARRMGSVVVFLRDADGEVHRHAYLHSGVTHRD